MRRVLLSGAAALLTIPAIVHAYSVRSSANTVRGKLTVACVKSGKSKGDGQYRYVLNGKPIRALTSDCAPGMAETHIAIEQVFASKDSTTVVVFEGFNSYSDFEKVLYIPKTGPASYIDGIIMVDDPRVTRKSPTAFHVVVPTGGYAIDMNHMSHWFCQIDVDFGTGRATAKIATPHEKGIPADVCKTKVEKAPI